MKTRLILPIAAILAFSLASGIYSNSAKADELVSADPSTKAKEDFVKDMANKTLSILQDNKKPYADRQVILRQAFAKVVDIDWIAKFVLGRPWNSATPEQRERFVALYRNYLTESYVSNFGEDPSTRISDIKIFGVKLDDTQHFTVHTQMRLANADQLKVDYLVSDNAGKYKVIDIIIENVSLLASHRAEFSSLASNKGVDSVIALLEKKQTSMTLSMNQ